MVGGWIFCFIAYALVNIKGDIQVIPFMVWICFMYGRNNHECFSKNRLTSGKGRGIILEDRD